MIGYNIIKKKENSIKLMHPAVLFINDYGIFKAFIGFRSNKNV